MVTRFLKSLLRHGTETLVAVVLVLAFFFLAMVLLGRAFPQGTGLGDLMRSPAEPPSASLAPIVRRTSSSTPSSNPVVVARLADMYRKVKGKASAEIVWADALLGELLENRHAVQTFDRSGASIAFENNGQVTLGENSLLVIRAKQSHGETGSGGVSLLMTQGDLRGIFEGPGGKAMPIEVVSGVGATQVVAGAGPTDLRVKVNPDKSSTYTVYRGASDVTLADETVRLHTNETITAVPDRPLGRPSKLPHVPSASGPDENAVVSYRSVPPRVRFSWSREAGADQYHFELARDRAFRDLVVTDRLPEAEFVHGNLDPGTYWWRVSSTLGWAESLSAPPRRLEVVEDRIAPELRVEFPTEPLESTSVVLRGATERGVTVFVGDIQVPIDDEGRFEYSLNLKRGSSVVVVEALDAAGNTAYRSGVLSARY